MIIIKPAIYLLLLLFAVHTGYAHAPHVNNDRKVVIVFEPQVDGAPLQLKSHPYINANGDSFYVDEFRFYISNIRLSGDGNDYVEKNSYHLIDADDTASTKVILNNITISELSGLQFIIGVDSAVNVSGAMGGDLDPTKGMYWAWNSGFIMAKLTGRSPVCKTLHHEFEFHIGGYKHPYSTARKVTLKINYISSGENGTIIIHVSANVNEWFKSPKLINLAATNEIVIPGADAAMVADNYADMFSISKIEVKQ